MMTPTWVRYRPCICKDLQIETFVSGSTPSYHVGKTIMISDDEQSLRRRFQRCESWRSIDDQVCFYTLRATPLGGLDGLAGWVDNDSLGQPTRGGSHLE
jgi:hypothetical protein